MSFDLRQLRYAVASADHRSFRRAAETMRVESSTFSRRIRKMEQQLGITIFERSRIGVRPTPAGLEFLRRARRVLAETDVMRSTAKAIGRGEAGGFAIGFHSSLSAGNLRATILEYVRRYPDVKVAGFEVSREHLFQNLDWGAIDIVIVSGEAPRPATLMRPFWSERLLVALPETHVLAAREQIHWADIRNEDFLLPEDHPGPDVEALLIGKLSAPGWQPKINRQAISRETILNVLSTTSMITVVSEASLGAKHPGIVWREVHDSYGPVHVGYSGYWRADNDNPALRRFLKLVAERYSLIDMPD